MRITVLALAILCAGSASILRAERLTPVGLRTEYLENPVGLDETRPRLTWQVQSDERGQRQTAYRILVASDAARLAAGQGDLWDSGKVASDETVNIVYAGPPLASRQSCFWRVKVWDVKGRESRWSRPARWSLGLLKPEDWQAQWISFRDTTPLHTNRSTTAHASSLAPTRPGRSAPTAQSARRTSSWAKRSRRSAIGRTGACPRRTAARHGSGGQGSGRPPQPLGVGSRRFWRRTTAARRPSTPTRWATARWNWAFSLRQSSRPTPRHRFA